MVSALTAAAKAWDVSKETIEQINRRIHDGVVIEKLNERADAYIKRIRTLFPYVEFDIQHALEIGSGLGFIMEAMERATRKAKKRKQIVGLDISASMIDAAKSRLSDRPERELFSFSLYDGVSMPFADESFDLVYSVAALQHIPKPFVYNLFFEIERVLRPNGYAVMHFLPFSCLPHQESHRPWREEISDQIGLTSGPHWHHFYSAEELNMVLSVGSGFKHIHIDDEIFACVRKCPITIPSHFDSDSYLKCNPDVAKAGVDPKQHFLKFGWKEHRLW